MKTAIVVMNWCQPKHAYVRRLGKQLTARAVFDSRDIDNRQRDAGHDLNDIGLGRSFQLCA
jgi:hypothetical protein